MDIELLESAIEKEKDSLFKLRAIHTAEKKKVALQEDIFKAVDVKVNMARIKIKGLTRSLKTERKFERQEAKRLEAMG